MTPTRQAGRNIYWLARPVWNYSLPVHPSPSRPPQPVRLSAFIDPDAIEHC